MCEGDLWLALTTNEYMYTTYIGALQYKRRMEITDISETNIDSTRTLASIQIIDNIEKHTGADSLELATILGWQIITRIGEAIVGTKVIYCEIDSMLPVDAPWLPLAIKDRIVKEQTKDFFRVKTIKLRGELSQGLIIPIVDTLPSHEYDSMEVGTNVTNFLGIKKYEPPALTGKFAMYATNSGSRFPTHLIDKTDEPRVQSNPKLFTLLQEKPYYITVKLDGTSVTYLINPDTQELMVCSRNLVRKRPDNLSVCPYWYIAAKYNIEEKLKQNPHLAVQGEICGPNIQRNLLGLKDLDLFVFNVVDIRNRSFMGWNNMVDICKNILGLSHVPLEEIGDSFSCENIKAILTKAQGTYEKTKNPREGLVIRSANGGIQRIPLGIQQSYISFKAINNDYLLKYGC